MPSPTRPIRVRISRLRHLGLGISASDAEELSSLVNGKTPVTITE